MTLPFFINRGSNKSCFRHAGCDDGVTTCLLSEIDSKDRLGVTRQVYLSPQTEQGDRSLLQDVGVYVLQGQVTFTFQAGEPSQVLRAGDFIGIPRHTIFRSTVEEAITRLITLNIPSGLDELRLATAFGPTDSQAVRFVKDLPPPHEQEGAANSLKPQPFVTRTESAPSFWLKPKVPELWTVLASGAQTHGAYTVSELCFTKGNAAGPMKYKQHDEIYYVLAGRGTVLLNSEIQSIQKNDFVYIPRGTVLALRADSEDEMLRMLIMHTPSGIIEGSLDFLGARPAKDRRKPPPDLENPGRDFDETMTYLESMGIEVPYIPDPLEISI